MSLLKQNALKMATSTAGGALLASIAAYATGANPLTAAFAGAAAGVVVEYGAAALMENLPYLPKPRHPHSLI